MSLTARQAARNREKHAENRLRRESGLPPLNRRHGQPMKQHDRVNVCRRVLKGVEIFDSNVRHPGYRRTFCGRYGTRAEAVAAAEQFLATGQRPQKPRQPRKPCDRRPAAPKPPKPVPAAAAVRGGGAERLAMLRRVWAERMAA